MNEKEKVSYLKALMYIALADDTIEESESQYLKQLGQIYGLTDSELSEIEKCIMNKEQSIEDVLTGITKKEHKLTLIYDLLALCYVDDNYSISEKSGMKNICSIMGVEEEKLYEFENLMEKQIELQKQINLALER